ncbi:MAG: FeoA family protein [Armatimonadetes bacterium]|jgi:ferrous iron transport protein A|nr:FeoA family protein [Armatimonadota bacterium]
MQDEKIIELECPETEEVCSLCCLKQGSRGHVLSVSGPNRCRLMELGFTSGAAVKVARKAAFGGPIEIELRSYRLSLRREEAEGIHVGVDPAAPSS